MLQAHFCSQRSLVEVHDRNEEANVTLVLVRMGMPIDCMMRVTCAAEALPVLKMPVVRLKTVVDVGKSALKSFILALPPSVDAHVCILIAKGGGRKALG